MPEKKAINNKESLLNIYQKYMRLSRYLFGLGDDSPFDINELPDDNEFLAPAKKIAKSLDISWKSMSHEESNRIMLALLEDTYKEMATVADKDKLVLETKLLILK
jgi:hypothetical protein